MKRIVFLLLLWSAIFLGCAPSSSDSISDIDVNYTAKQNITLEENGYYTGKDEVALYIHTFGKLPDNYITKQEAMEKGWVATEGNLWEVTDRKSIGGDCFYNREGKLPEKDGRMYYEADVNYNGGFRGPERIVYSNDGLIYYTPDHYESFILMYGDD